MTTAVAITPSMKIVIEERSLKSVLIVAVVEAMKFDGIVIIFLFDIRSGRGRARERLGFKILYRTPCDPTLNPPQRVSNYFPFGKRPMIRLITQNTRGSDTAATTMSRVPESATCEVIFA